MGATIASGGQIPPQYANYGHLRPKYDGENAGPMSGQQFGDQQNGMEQPGGQYGRRDFGQAQGTMHRHHGQAPTDSTATDTTESIAGGATDTTAVPADTTAVAAAGSSGCGMDMTGSTGGNDPSTTYGSSTQASYQRFGSPGQYGPRQGGPGSPGVARGPRHDPAGLASRISAADADGDGIVTSAELTSSISAHEAELAQAGRPKPTGAPDAASMASRLLSRLDADGDGALSNAEIATLVAQATGATDATTSTTTNATARTDAATETTVPTDTSTDTTAATEATN